MESALQNPKHLRVVLIWDGTILEERTLVEPRAVTIGPHRRATFVVPQRERLPRRFPLLSPSRPGYLLTLAPGMCGKLNLSDAAVSVEEFLSSAPDRKGFRATPIGDGDWGLVALDPDERLQIFFQF